MVGGESIGDVRAEVSVFHDQFGFQVWSEVELVQDTCTSTYADVQMCLQLPEKCSAPVRIKNSICVQNAFCSFRRYTQVRF